MRRSRRQLPAAARGYYGCTDGRDINAKPKRRCAGRVLACTHEKRRFIPCATTHSVEVNQSPGGDQTTMTTAQRNAALGLLALAATALGIITQCVQTDGVPVATPTPEPTTTPTPVPTTTPTPSPTQVAQILDSLESPNYSTAWQTKIVKSVPKNYIQVIYIKSTKPCELVGKAQWKVLKIQVKVPSHNQLQPGMYYDPMVPLTAINCADATMLAMDIEPNGTTQLIQIQDASIQLNYKSTLLPSVPVKPLYAEHSNAYMLRGYYGAYKNEEARATPILAMLVKHKVLPIKSFVAMPPETATGIDLNALGAVSFQKQVIDFSPKDVWFPNFTTQTALQKANSTALQAGLGSRAWAYVKDEPQASEMPSLIAALTLQKTYAPNIKTMVTTPFKPELKSLVDIFVPVLEQFGQGSWPSEAAYANNTLWLYTSCMAAGCGPQRNSAAMPDTIPSGSSGAPSLTLDEHGTHIPAFFIMAHKFPNVKALLYYAVNQGWLMYPAVDTLVDSHNFGNEGDGNLIYPGRPGFEGLTDYQALPSVRLKAIQRASQLSDCVSLQQAAMKPKVDALITNSTSFNASEAAWNQFETDCLNLL